MIRLIEPELIDEGDGAKAYRLLPNKGDHLDPFVIFDEYFIDPTASFPMHPHGGFEGFQFLAEGATRYEDDQGNIGRIEAGEIRRFVPADGFHHSELPVSQGTVRGFLLWIKLPDDLVLERSIFRELYANDVQVNDDEKVRETVIFGEGAPLETFTPSVFKHLSIKHKHTMDIELASGWNGFVYLSKGRIILCGELIPERTGAILDQGIECRIEAEEGSEFVIIRGKMLGEKIVQEGHFVRSKEHDNE